MRTIEVQGDTIHVDDSKRGTWRAFELYSVISDPDATPFAQLKAMMQIIEYCTDTTERAIVDKFGGDDADLKTVMEYVAEVVQGISSKN